MNWSFRTKLTAVIFLLTLTSVGGLTAFLLHLYRKDKLAGILENERSNIAQVASRLGSLISLADSIDLGRVPQSRELVFLYENPCGRAGAARRGVVADAYSAQFAELELKPETWSESLEVFKACSRLEAETAASGGTATLVPSEIQFMVPYVLALIRGASGERLAMFAMSGFSTAAGNTLFIVDSSAEIRWAADGAEYVRAAIKDTRTSPEELSAVARTGLATQAPGVSFTGSEGVAAYVRAGPDWVVVSLSYLPTIMIAVDYATRQALFLVGGVFFLCLFIGRLTARLVTRPLDELRASAERIGKGDFETKLVVKGTDEISVVKGAFNRMMDEIVLHIAAMREKAILESELKLAHEVQTMLFPETSVKVRSHSLFSHTQTATQCGGDWWGYIEVERDEKAPLLITLVGDVVGHGAASALITGTVRGAQTILQAWIERDPSIAQDPREITRFFNRTVFEAARGALSMTFFVAILDIEAETLVCSNAGHNLPYLLIPPAEGGEPQLKVVGRSGIPLGHALDSEYSEIVTAPWSPGSQLVLYTDGLTEVLRGTDFLWDRKALKRGLKKFGAERGKDLLRHLLHDRKESIQDAIEEDDVTVVICEARAPERPATKRRQPLAGGTAEPLAPVAEPAFPEAVEPLAEPPPAEPARPAEEPPLPDLVEPVTEPRTPEGGPA